MAVREVSRGGVGAVWAGAMGVAPAASSTAGVALLRALGCGRSWPRSPVVADYNRPQVGPLKGVGPGAFPGTTFSAAEGRSDSRPLGRGGSRSLDLNRAAEDCCPRPDLSLANEVVLACVLRACLRACLLVSCA